MLTSLKLMKECPLSQYKDIPSNLNYFSFNADCASLYRDALDLWQDKKYFLFFLALGSVFEFILFELSLLSTVTTYRINGLENKLPKNEVWLTSRRGEKDNLSTIFSELANKDESFIKNGSFYSNQLWTESQCLKFVMKNLLIKQLTIHF